MTLTATPAITHRITYDRLTRDFACYVQVAGDPEQYIGSAASYLVGETTCLDYRRELLESDVFTPATALDGVRGDCGATLNELGQCERCIEDAEQTRDRDSEADGPAPWQPPAGCKRDVLGERWTICRAPGDGPCYCGVTVRARPAPRILCACGNPALVEEPWGTFCGRCYVEEPVMQVAA